MIRLHLFGAPEIRRPGEDSITPVLVGPKRLALLSCLVLNGRGSFLRRESLLGLLWPDSDERRARGALRNLLYELRRAMGRRVIRTRGQEEVGVDPSEIWCDVWAFDEALSRGANERALELYGGPLLEGFHIPGASPALEHRLDTLRRETRRRAVNAARELTDRAEASEAWDEAVSWARRGASIDRGDSEAWERLIRLLVKVNRPVDAVRCYEAHASWLHSELGLGPPESMTSTVGDLHSVDSTARPGSGSPRRPWRRRSGGREMAHSLDPVRGNDAPDGHSSSPSPERSRWTAPVLGSAAVLLGLSMAALILDGGGVGRFEGVQPSEDVVAIFPFQYHGSPRFEYLSTGMVDLISPMVDGAGQLRSVDPAALTTFLPPDAGTHSLSPSEAADLARRVGAGRFVLGSVTELGDRIQLRASLYGEGEARRASSESLAPAEDSLFNAVDELMRKLLAAEMDRTHGTLAGLAARSTGSLPALKAYLKGERRSRRGDANGASAAFREAVALDSTFALAYYRLAISTGWGEGRSLPAARKAMALANRLPPTGRRLLEALYRSQTGRHREAERIYRAILDREPENTVAAWGLAEMLHHFAGLTGRRQRAAEAAWRRVLALRPHDMWSIYEASDVAARLGKYRWLDSLVSVAEELAPDERWTTVMQVRRAFASGDPEVEARAIARLEKRGHHFEIAGRVAHQGDLRGAQRILRLAQEPESPPRIQGLALLGDGLIEAALGRWISARALFRRASDRLPGPALALEAAVAAAPWVPALDAELRVLRERLRREGDAALENADFRVPTPYLRLYLIGMLSVRLGQPMEAEHQASILDTLPSSEEFGSMPDDLARSVRAHIAHAEGELQEALSELERMKMDVSIGLHLNSIMGSHAHARLLRAELLQELGRHRGALAWYEGAVGVSVFGILNTAPAELGMADAYASMGDDERASEHYTRFSDLWRATDPELRSSPGRIPLGR